MPLTNEPVKLDVMGSVTIKKKCNCGSVYITVGIDANKFPRKTMTRVGKSGGCGAAFTESIGRLITRALEHGDNPREIANSLSGVKCSQGGKPSCPDCIAQAMLQLLSEGTIVDGQEDT